MKKKNYVDDEADRRILRRQACPGVFVCIFLFYLFSFAERLFASWLVQEIVFHFFQFFVFLSFAERLVQEAIERVMVGRTVLIVAHRLSTVVKKKKKKL